MYIFKTTHLFTTPNTYSKSQTSTLTLPGFRPVLPVPLRQKNQTKKSDTKNPPPSKCLSKHYMLQRLSTKNK